MISMQCGACGKSVPVDEKLGAGQLCPLCRQPVGKLPVAGRAESTALDALNTGVKPVRFGAYGKAADAAWDDPTEAGETERVSHLVADEALIDNAVINAVPPEIEAKYRERQREIKKKLMTLGIVVVVIVIVLAIFILY